MNNGRIYKIYLTDIYTVSLADVMELSSSYDIDAIVTISAWNGYTLEAKEYLSAMRWKANLVKANGSMDWAVF